MKATRRRRAMRGCVLALLAVLFAVGPAGSAHAAIPATTVMLYGQPAPGLPSNVTFATGQDGNFSGSFFNPTINAKGQVAFYAGVSGPGITIGNNVGLWAGTPGSASLVALTTDHASGMPPGVNFLELPPRLDFNQISPAIPPEMSADGQITFRAKVTGLGIADSNNEGIWAGPFGNLGVQAREGSPAPGTAGDVFQPTVGSSFVFSPPTMGAGGHVAFTAYLDGPDALPNAFAGVWSGTTSNVGLVARLGDQAPGAPAGAVFARPDPMTGLPPFTQPVVNPTGVVAFSTALAGTGVTVGNDLGVWSGTPGNLALVAREGDQAPGMPAGVVFRSITGPTPFGSPVINGQGQVAFAANALSTAIPLQGGSGIWSGTPGNLALVAGSGMHAPGTPDGVNFASLFEPNQGMDYPVMNAAGEVAFLGKLNGPGVDVINGTNATGIWAGRPGDLQLIARKGDQVPGQPPGVVFLGLIAPSINAQGDMIFFAGTTNGMNGLWGVDHLGHYALILRNGDMLEIAPGDVRTLSFFNFALNSGNEDGLPSAFNDRGQIVFRASFTDGSTGMFVINAFVPEPAPLVLAAMALVALLVVARRRGRRSLPAQENELQTRRRASLWASLLAAAVASVAPRAALAGSTTTVALSGAPAPGVPAGLAFQTFGFTDNAPGRLPPSINGSGEVAFVAQLSGADVTTANDAGIWAGDAGSLALVAREGNQAAGLLPGVSYATLVLSSNGTATTMPPAITPDGTVAFWAQLSGVGVNSTNDLGLWSGTPGNAAPAAVESDHAAGMSAGVNYGSFTVSPPPSRAPLTNAGGRVAFAGLLTGFGVSAFAPSNDAAIWTGAPGAVLPVVREGDSLPGLPAGVTFGQSSGTQISLNDSGKIAFVAALEGIVSPLANSGIWTGTPGNLSLVALEGDQAPGTPAGTKYFSGSAFQQPTFSAPSINAAGQVAFAVGLLGNGVTAANDSGVWVGARGAVALVAREGDQAPGTPSGVHFSSEFSLTGVPFIAPVVDASGDVGFVGLINGPGDSGAGIWATGAGGLRLIARNGDPAPGAPAGVTLTFGSAAFAMNAGGQLAFSTTISSGGSGVWIADAIGNLTPVAIAGGQIEVAPGDFRTIGNVSFCGGSGGGDGNASGLNDAGQVAFWAQFTDGTSGIFISNAVASVPEPTTIVLAASAFALLSFKRRAKGRGC